MLSWIFSVASPFWLAGNWSFNLFLCIRLMKEVVNEVNSLVSPSVQQWKLQLLWEELLLHTPLPECLNPWKLLALRADFWDGPGENAHYQVGKLASMLMAQPTEQFGIKERRIFIISADSEEEECAQQWQNNWLQTGSVCCVNCLGVNTGSPGWG